MALAADVRIAVIGGGKMGEAILGGWIASDRDPAAPLSAANFVVANPGAERRAYLAERYGVTCVADAREIDTADVVVLAVKPQVMRSVLESIADESAYGADRAPLFISIAAGLSTAQLLAMLPAGARLVRVMPNTPLLVGAGVTTVCTASSRADDVALVRDLFACLGSAYLVEEDAMDATGALSGSGPAYVAHAIEALRDAGVAQGLDAELAERLAADTFLGTCLLMREKEQTPEQTRVAVCSPGGTTLAALAAMDEAGFAAVFDAGIAAAVRRSKELASC